ncbi:MAG TPA: thioredoxin family protein [Bacillota bacterium]|nr:thioredoxin family protein [Bacillota bacterium]
MLIKTTKTLLVTLISFGFGIGIFWGGFVFNQNSQSALAAMKPETGKVIDASKNFLEPGKNKRMMVMELGSTTCIPCKAMVPILEKLAKEQKGKLDVQFVDVYKRGDLAEKYNIYAIPTQILFSKNGKELFRHEGFYPEEEITKKLKELGFK